jgi:CHRD domain
MTKKSVLVLAAVSTAVFADVGATAQSRVGSGPVSQHRRGRLSADLRSYNEVPTLSTSGRGSFFGSLSEDETEIRYRLDYSGLEGTVTVSHIHLGSPHTTGGVSIWLCGATPPAPMGTPACGESGGMGPEATGTLTAVGVVGPAAQGIAPGEFAELVKAIKAGAAYVNVHSSLYGTGEIRGQIRVD